MKKKILRNFIAISSLIFTLTFITISVHAEVEEEERVALTGIRDKIEQYAPSIDLKIPKRAYVRVLTAEEVFYVLNISNRECAGRPMLVDFTIPQTGVVATSDWHGDLTGLTKTAQVARSQGKLYVITGDVVDRGLESVECAIYALICQTLDPEHFIYLAGDHEFESVNRQYGLWNEVTAKYKSDASSVYQALNGSFSYLSLAAVGDGRVFFSHAGFGETTNPSRLRNLKAPRSSWQFEEVSFGDEKDEDPEELNSKLNEILERLNPEEKATFARLKDHYELNILKRGYSKKNCSLILLNLILNPQKLITELTWSDFLPEARPNSEKFPTNKNRNSYFSYDGLADMPIDFTIEAVLEFCNEHEFEMIVRGHEHGGGFSDCGFRLTEFCGKKVVTLTSSKRVYYHTRERVGRLLFKGDVVHIAKNLTLFSEDAERYGATLEREEEERRIRQQREQGQKHCDALLDLANDLVISYISQMEAAKAACGNPEEALQLYIGAQVTNCQILNKKFMALAEKYPTESEESSFFAQKIDPAWDVEFFYSEGGEIAYLGKQLIQIKNEANAAIMKFLYRSKAKELKEQIEQKIQSFNDFLDDETLARLNAAGQADFDFHNTNATIKALAAQLADF
jgi:hypothetical protein